MTQRNGDQRLKMMTEDQSRMHFQMLVTGTMPMENQLTRMSSMKNSKKFKVLLIQLSKNFTVQLEVAKKTMMKTRNSNKIFDNTLQNHFFSLKYMYNILILYISN